MRNARRERAIDETLIESFPASDPPSWTLGVDQPHAPNDDATKDTTEAHATTDPGSHPVIPRSFVWFGVFAGGAALLALLARLSGLRRANVGPAIGATLAPRRS